MVRLGEAVGLFLKEESVPVMDFAREDYEQRVDRLVRRMEEKELTHMVIYGDREHFSNVEYFTHYDCRFEETLLVVSQEGRLSMVVGNEGMGYSRVIPVDVDRYLYQNFSLQGQPRDKLELLERILGRIGLNEGTYAGIVGVKYFHEGEIDSDPDQTYDLPQYILDAIKRTGTHMINATKEITGVPDGIRMRLYTAKEIAWAETAGNRAASVVQRLLKHMKEGIREYELAELAGVGFDPQNTWPLVNFGEESVNVGMGSPRNIPLVAGEPGGVCYSVRGNLTSRVAILAYGEESCKEELKPYLDSFYKKYFEALAAWYETLRVGATGGELHDAVMSLIGGEEYGVTLNVGHNTGTEEWSNAISYKNSEIPVVDGAFMQADIIAHGENPVRTAICEDAVVVAGKDLRRELEAEYPEVYERIRIRRQAMRDVLGIRLHEDVLPMSNLNGAYFPFLLNTGKVLVKK